jgi:hypothetical protein
MFVSENDATTKTIVSTVQGADSLSPCSASQDFFYFGLLKNEK